MYRYNQRLKLLLLLATLLSCNPKKELASFQKNQPINFTKVKITDNFWQPRLKTHATVTLDACINQSENETQRIKNFAIAAGMEEGEFKGYVYDDSDVYKMIEGASYSLMNNPNAALEKKLDDIIEKIANAQLEDGYLMTYYQLGDLNKRWTDMDKHEMYCAGHLIEAGIAHFNATGKRTLLDVAIKFADHIEGRFGQDKKEWVPGHQEIELALVKLYRVTNDKRYLELSDWLLKQRGQNKGDWKNKDYYQDLIPVKDLSKISGHAVRAMYMFTGMADLASANKDMTNLAALDRLWNDVIGTKMYLTGGIGSSKKNEGFTADFDLPNEEAYCETCASVGMVFWNQRMNMLKGDGKYIDVLERSMYNGALAGISLAGNKFFYVNPLASSGGHHRKEWYGTACCPSQISRFLPSIGNYVYSTSDDAIWVNLYMGNESTIEFDNQVVNLKQETDYPWEGGVHIVVDPKSGKNFKIKLRVPEWCKKYSLKVNGKALNLNQDKQYLVIDRKWKKDDVIEFDMDMPVEVVKADPRVKANIGRRAIQRGPLVYCLEGVDNSNIDLAVLNSNMTFDYKYQKDLLDGIVTIEAKDDKNRLTFVPYYAWDNREPGKMAVWVNYKEMNTQTQKQVNLLKDNPYYELPLGSIKANGWLKEMLERQRTGSTSQLDELYPEVMGSRNGWLGGDGDQWERGPYWIDGLLPLAYILDDDKLKAKVQPWIEWALQSQQEDGFFGPSVNYDPEPGLQRNNSRDWWPRMVMLKVLKQYYSATNDVRVIDFMTKYFQYQLKTLPSQPLGNWSFWAEYRVADNIQVVYWLYRITKEPFLLDLSRLLQKQGHNFTDMVLNQDALKRINTIHCVNLAQGIKNPTVYYQQDQRPEYLSAVKEAFKDIKQFHGQAQGMYGGDEALHGNNPTQGSELCSAVELMFSLEEMLQITGDMQFADHVEKIAFNALPTQISDDFMTKQYFQQANQVMITKGIRNFDVNHGGTDLLYGLLTGYPCCTSNMHQGWPKFTQNLWYSTADKGLAALVYSPSEVETKVGDEVSIKMTEETCYPMSDKINFTLEILEKDIKSVDFPFHLRIPEWCDTATISINGALFEKATANSIAVVKRIWKSGDQVQLHLPMRLKTQKWHENSVSIERGPLVYALRIEEEWKEKTFDDPNSIYGKTYYEVLPLSKWNYGLLDFDLEDLENEFEVIVDEKKVSNNYPWNLENAPIQIKVKAKEIPSWQLYNEMAGPVPYSKVLYGLGTKSMPVEEITLIPYGSTTLRISQFPVIKE